MEILNEQSNDLQLQFMMSPFSLSLQEQHIQVKEELFQCFKNEELVWAQRARANWLNLGDRNTKNFQAQANVRKRCNTISQLKDPCGLWITSEQEISQLIICDFKNRFHRDTTPSSNSMNDLLILLNLVLAKLTMTLFCSPPQKRKSGRQSKQLDPIRHLALMACMPASTKIAGKR